MWSVGAQPKAGSLVALAVALEGVDTPRLCRRGPSDPDSTHHLGLVATVADSGVGSAVVEVSVEVVEEEDSAATGLVHVEELAIKEGATVSGGSHPRTPPLVLVVDAAEALEVLTAVVVVAAVDSTVAAQPPVATASLYGHVIATRTVIVETSVMVTVTGTATALRTAMEIVMENATGTAIGTETVSVTGTAVAGRTLGGSDTVRMMLAMMTPDLGDVTKCSHPVLG